MHVHEKVIVVVLHHTNNDGIHNDLNNDPKCSIMQVGVGNFLNFMLTISYNSIC